MHKYFNVAGPCVPGEHYMLPAQERCQGILDLIDQKQYFVIHAARQSGKTTLLLELTKSLNAAGNYHGVYCSLETLRGIADPAEGIPRILDELRNAVEEHEILAQYPFAEGVDPAQYTLAIRKALSSLCKHVDRPIVLFIDEIDCLSNGTLIAFLQQLRYGYVKRSRSPFIHSIALVGMRNIRDYKGKIREDRDTLGSSSPFNIVKRALTLHNFTCDDVARLYMQHTEETGQVFSPEVVNAVFEATQGQPWLVNAIACEIVEEILHHETALPILPEYVESAVETIIKRRGTHIDSLMERLTEERVRRIVEPVIVGTAVRYDLLDDDYRFVLDLGLLREQNRQLTPANPIYGEIIIRTLSFRTQQEIEDVTPHADLPFYLKEGMLNMTSLLQDFQRFWRENSNIWQEKFEYKEAAPHLILQAFLQRVLNAGGRIIREMAGGRKRLDLCVEYQDQCYPIELKIRYDTQVVDEGKDQLAGYMDTLGCSEGWLLIFDRRTAASWEEKIFWCTEKVDNKTIHVVGC